MEIIRHKPTYGYDITQQLRRRGFNDIVEGTVYTILVRLEKNNLVSTEKKPSALGPPRKFYSLTVDGHDALESFWSQWEFISSTINSLRK